MKYLKECFKANRARIAILVACIAAAAYVDPAFALMIALTTSTAQLGNGTIVQVAVGSPTSFVTVNNCRNVTFMDGSAAEVDVSNLTSTWKERLLGLPDGGTVSFECDTDLSDAGQLALITAKNSRIKCTFKIILPAGATPNATFDGYVRKFNINTNVDQAVKSNVELLVTGPVTLA